jgi:hypothetical protein
MKIPNFSRPTIIFISAIILLEAANLGYIFYLSQTRKCETAQAVPCTVSQETPAITPDQEAVLKAAAPGTAGELEQKEGQTQEQALAEVNPAAIDNPVLPPGTQMPSAIFNTQGDIVSVQSDGITIQGDGSNFEDQKSRQLTIKFDDKTSIFEKNNTVKYTGLAGLKHLSAGERVLIESGQNIRGKTEFTVTYVNKI